MVGVAGKSQACNTCRERRLKCDLRRPFCRKCAKAKRECTGYDRGNRIFVNRSPSSPSTNAAEILSKKPHQYQPSPANPGPTAEEADMLYRLFRRSDISDDNSPQKFRKCAVGLLKATYLPNQHVTHAENTRQGSFSWVYGLEDLDKPSRSLDTALFAFCITQLHVTRTGGGNTSLYECLDTYNTALQYLASDLDAPDRLAREETIAAILVLSIHELFVSPRQNGWSIHARGITEILRLREPGKSKSPAWRHLTTRMRVLCTLEALTKRQGQILLDNDIWRQIVHESGFNGALDEVYHMIGDVPTMLGQAATLSFIADANVLLNESAIVVRDMLAIVDIIEAWHDAFWKAAPTNTPRYRLVPSTAINPADRNGDGGEDKVFPYCFEFESLNVGVPIVMCWAVIAQLYSNIIQICELVELRLGYPHRIALGALLARIDDTNASSVDMSSLPLAAAATSNKKNMSIDNIASEGTRMARYVCQSLEYYHRVEMGTYGGHSTTYPCWSARQYFRLHAGHEREEAWVRNIHNMKGPGTRWGLSMMTFADVAEPLGSRFQNQPSGVPSFGEAG
ncbi:hypothetical protein F5Y09DRAFT_332959 [Xylaria sp. FL1042]|nr:hypothetical protein F5Y09DRAFT_332959 [Xylaria sp. FL1042]